MTCAVLRRLVLPVALLSALTLPAEEPQVGSLSERVAALAQPIVDAEEAPGLVVGLLHDGTSDVFAFGKSGSPDGRPLDADTVFEIGSVTKVFTALLLADRVQRGMLVLDDPAQKYLPQAVTLPRGKEREIRLVDLATHASGLPRMPDNFAPRDPANPYADYTPEQLYDFLGRCRLTREPGAAVEYSNLGAGLLGHLLALQAGKEWRELVAEVVTEPLGMADTSVRLSDAQRSRLAQGHDAEGKPTGLWDIATLTGAGALRSTVRDMLRFVAAQLDPASTPLAAAITATHAPRQSMGPSGAVALGWHLAAEGAILWHNGGTGGFHSFVGFAPQERRGVVVLCNGSVPAPDELGMKLFRVLAGEAVPTPPKRTPIPLDPALADRYVGTYRLAPGFDLAVTRAGDRLMAQATGQGAFRLFPESATKFFARVADIEITFFAGETGPAERLVLRQNGHETVAPRVEAVK